MSKKRVFSGIQPSGELHLGNYIGAIKNWVKMQEEFSCIYCVVDLHAITVPQNPAQLREKTIEIANIVMSSGVDANKSIVFIQSHVPQHTELTWLLNCVTYFGELSRMTQFKEKGDQQRENVSAGLFDYPVLMASDILLYNTDVVPVGEDQRQHLELTRDVAIRFNNRFGKTFVVPEARIGKVGARVMGLDDPTKKMSKSAASPNNYISLTDSEGVIRQKLKRAVTDTGREILFNPEEKPAISNLLTIYSELSGQSIKELEAKYEGSGYAKFKEELADVVVNALKPFQEKFASLQKDKKSTLSILEDGAAKAKEIAEKKIKEVKEKMGLDHL